MSIKTNTYIAVVLRSIIYGSSIIFTSKLYSNGVSVLDVLSLRTLITASIFIILWLIGYIKLNYTKRELRLLFLAALFEPVLDFTFENLGIKYSTTIMTAIIFSFAPVLAMILETVFLKEKTTPFQKVLLFISSLGTVYVTVCGTKNEGKNTFIGVVFLIAAIAFEQMFYITSRKASINCEPISITFFMSVFGAVVFNGVNVGKHLVMGNIQSYFEPFKDYDNLVGFVFLGFVASFLATLMSNIAVSKIQVSLMVALGGISTVTTIFLGVIFNNETLQIYHIIGSAVILSSAILVNIFKKNETINETALKVP